MQIVRIEEAALFEETPLHPADEILDSTLLLKPLRPADLDAQLKEEPGEAIIFQLDIYPIR